MNKLLVVDEHHYYRTPDGVVWIPSQNDYYFWKRYLNVFDKIKVVGRMQDIDKVPNNMLVSSGPNVEFYAIPNYTGPIQYALKFFSVRKKLSSVHLDCTHAIFRLPSELSFNIYHDFLKSNKPYAVELLIDPWDALAPGTTSSIVRPLVRRRWHRLVGEMCLSANGAAYVTERILQNRYPCKAGVEGESDRYFTSHYSSINMPSEFLSSPRMICSDRKTYVISHVGTMQNYIKGQDVLLKAIKEVRDRGYDVKCTLVGDGKIKDKFLELAMVLGINEHVKFTGNLCGSHAVRDILINSDIFVFPTKAEGLPRVLIEAMACALPCVSTPVNGVPELLTDDFLVNPQDVNGFANKIIWLINNRDVMMKVSKKNRELAEGYTADKLEQRRTLFYRKLLALN